MKYIIFKGAHFTFPVLFPDIVTHSQIICMVSEGKGEVVTPETAGFVHMDEKGVACTGQSESLKLGISPVRDAILIASMLMNYGSYAFDNNLIMQNKQVVGARGE